MVNIIKSSILILSLFFTTCGVNYEQKKSQSEPASYFLIREQIIKPQCVSCHPSFESHEVLMGMIDRGYAEDSRLYKVISSDEMPPTGRKVPKERKEVLKQWIDDGAPL